MRKNYLLSVFGVFLCLSGFSQSSTETYKDSTNQLARAAGEALDNYDFNRSIEESLSLIELASQREDFHQLNHGYNLLGITYEMLEDSIRAKENYLKALEFARLSNNDTLLWYAYNNLGNVYSSNKRTVTKGFEYYRKAIGIASKNPEEPQAIIPVVNIAWTLLENDKFEIAYPYLEKAKGLLKGEEDVVTRTNLNTLFGMYYSGTNDFKTSRKFFEEGINIAERDSLIVEASFAYEEYADMLFKSKDYNAAYGALNKHQEYREKIFSRDKNLQREAVYERFQTEEYKKDLEAARREQLFKDEVRELGLALGLSHEMVFRHPFPGPGLGVRILGEVKREYAELLRRADAIFIEELRISGWYEKTSQAFAVFLPVKSVGVMGDGRTYDYVVALRAVQTEDFMTAHWAELPYTLLAKISNRIVNEVRGINRVVYDISGKPPATIEWE